MARLVAVITCYNRADFVQKCVTSLLDSARDGLDVFALVMDNGSVDDSPQVAAALGEQVRVEHTPDNRPVISVINRGLRIALNELDSDYIIIMNEDTEFRPGAIDTLLSVLGDHPNALMTPLQLNYRQPDRVDPMALRLARNADGLLEDLLMGRPMKPAYTVRTIVGAGMLARREVWDRLGYWDELFRFYGPDDDYCNRALYLGYEVLLVPGAHLLHAHGQLNAEIRDVNINDTRKFRLQTQMRYMALLKNPKYSLTQCFVQYLGRFIADESYYLSRGWFAGMWAAATQFWDCLIKLPRVASARRDQFSEARRAPKG
jgi:GT2 family glycosyltransferase